MQEVELCSRGRSGAGELEALDVGLRMCTICESTAPKVSEKKRESRERNFVILTCLFFCVELRVI